MHYFSLALAVIFSALGTAPARALDAAQVEAVDRLLAAGPPGKAAIAAMASHYAVLLWVEDYCNGRSSEDVRAYIMSKTSSDPDAFEVGWAAASDLLNSSVPAAMCELALLQYGPDGVLIKGAWAPKR